MKHICRLLCLLLVLVLLTGCNGKAVASVSPAPSEETTAPTTLATEPPTEPPTEAPTERRLTAFDIYFKAKAAAPDPATGYTVREKVLLRTGANGMTIELDMTNTTQAQLSRDPFAIHRQKDTFATMMGVEIEQSVREYYRQEGEDMVYYCDLEQLGMTFREVLPRKLYSEEEIAEYPELDIPLDAEYLIDLNSHNGYPLENYAEYIELEPQTQTLDGREVYVLCYQQTALWLFGFTEDAAVDADLGDIRIPTYWYVDAETFMPVKTEYTMTDLDPMVTAAMVSILNIQLPEDVTGLELEIVEYTHTLENMTFDPVEVPEIPQEILDRAESYE